MDFLQFAIGEDQQEAEPRVAKSRPNFFDKRLEKKGYAIFTCQSIV